MLLPSGVTGFYQMTSPKPPHLQKSEVIKDCYACVYLLDGKVEDIWEESDARSFYVAVLKVQGQSIHALFNQQYPLVAFASQVDYFQIRFMNHSLLANALEHYGYRVFSVEELHTLIFVSETKGKLTISVENELNLAEWEQLRKWKPQTVGEVIFNFWD